MDSPIVSNILRQLCHCRARHCLRSKTNLRNQASILQRRNASNTSEDVTQQERKWQPRIALRNTEKVGDYERFPMVTAEELRSRKDRPKRVKMLLRDFIEDSLYNPNYGYFTKQVVIFSSGEPFQFNRMRSESEFHRQLSQRYTEFEDALDAKSPNPTRQLWHTPTELFRPYYGDAIARYLVSNYKLTQYPYHDLIIYELGAGNGTLMLNILDYIRDTDPEVYARTQFRVIEISPSLASLQRRTVHENSSSRTHKDKITIINRSIFNWNTYDPSPCFFLALEVFDNFPHDSIRYDISTGQPYQSTVLIDSKGDFYEFHVPDIDPVARIFLRGRDAACHDTNYPHPLNSSRLKRLLYSQIPFSSVQTEPEYIPTRLMNFFQVLQAYFPAHRLLTSDFHQLPDTIKGINAPVVQTRYKRRTVPVSTPLVQQGYFDILFPTNFPVIESIYQAITGKFTRLLSQEEFLQRWAYVEDTRTSNGENPMLTWYKNASVLTTL